MDDFFINYFIGFFSALLLFFGFFWIYFQKNEQKGRAVIKRFYELKVENARLEEQLQSSKNLHDMLRVEFENIANNIMVKNSKISHTHMESILQPFKENIREFNQKIEHYYKSESNERFSLIKEIEKLRVLNSQISQDAINLTKALKGDNKIQGDWGEYILERILESSGLKRGREYEIQKEFKDENRRSLRPDVIIHLPEKKDIVVDSKLSLTAYEMYHSCSDNQREIYLQKHLNSINTHIKLLSQKEYEKRLDINTLDFVLMFIPIESAFLLAIEMDRDLYERAYSQNIILVSPSTLLAVLRTIQNSWRWEYQNKNAQLIAKKAGDMHDKFISFINEMQNVESSLLKAQNSYNSAFKKLSSGKGNLINRAKELRELDGVYHKRVKRDMN